MKKKRTDLLVKRSSAGLGLFATATFKKGDFIIQYKGPLLTDDQADEKGGKYLFTIKKDKIIDGSGRDNLARYINHSCAPNAEAINEDDQKILIHARKKILPGEEITYDYGKEYFDDFIGKNCRCTKCTEKQKSPIR